MLTLRRDLCSKRKKGSEWVIILRVVLRVGGETTGHFQAGYGGMLASLEK